MKRELCELIVNYPTVTILGLTALAILCMFSVLGTVCFLGIFCLLILSVQKGRNEGWIKAEPPESLRRRPRRQNRSPDSRSRQRKPEYHSYPRTQAPKRR